MSLAASLPLPMVEKYVGNPMAVFRAMPNIPAVVEEGATGIAFNAIATEADQGCGGTDFLFGRNRLLCGRRIDDAVTALSGSGPAYVS